jgi:hypothetical protein
VRISTETWKRIERRAQELAMIHGGQPTPRDWTHAARELLEFPICDPSQPVGGYNREGGRDHPAADRAR